MCGSECAERLAFYVIHLASFRIIYFLCFPEEPVHSVTDTWRDVDILEQGEVRKSDLEVMRHTVLEFIPEARFVELRCLEVDLVLYGCVITQ